MTKKHFVLWLEAHDCELSPFQAFNSVNPTLIVVNKANGRDAFLGLPIDDTRLSDSTICMVCLKLLIPVPEGIVCLSKPFK